MYKSETSITRICDNCKSMTLFLGRNGMLQRFCTILHLFINEDKEATCRYHRFESEKGVWR